MSAISNVIIRKCDLYLQSLSYQGSQNQDPVGLSPFKDNDIQCSKNFCM